MGKYELVSRCKKCGKIYPHGIPYICYKVTLTDNCEKVIAKKTLLGWKIKEMESD